MAGVSDAGGGFELFDNFIRDARPGRAPARDFLSSLRGGACAKGASWFRNPTAVGSIPILSTTPRATVPPGLHRVYKRPSSGKCRLGTANSDAAGSVTQGGLRICARALPRAAMSPCSSGKDAGLSIRRWRVRFPPAILVFQASCRPSFRSLPRGCQPCRRRCLRRRRASVALIRPRSA